MNHVYRLVWNEREQRHLVAPETAKAKSKGRTRGGSPHKAAGVALACALGAASPAWALDANALPTGGSVSAGVGAIASSGNTMNITQTSQKLAIDWQSFNIGANATVNFIQPSSSAIALNRVLGSDPSQIFGHLNANGQVFLLNPNGILFGKGAEVNIGGLVAATQSLSNADFMNGNYRFSGAAGSISNEGNLNGRYVALLGGQISNQGTIAARLGTVALAAGGDITLDFVGDGLTSVAVRKGTYNALVENKQIIQADGGTVLMTARAADALIQAVVNNEGVIEARTVDNSSGTIKLLADMDNGVVKLGGTLDASAPNDKTGGTGGFIETSGQTMQVQNGAKVLAKSWLIDPTDLTIDAAMASSIGTSLNSNTDVTESASNNITVANAVSWTSANTLTLDAGNKIAINADITASNGTLKLLYGNGYTLAGGAKVNLSAGNHFYTNGTAWTVVTALGSAGSTTGTDLQGVNGNLSGHYALGADIDALSTSGWNAGDGFNPLGNSSANFTGAFDGLGHTINNLNINRTATNYVGLFGVIGSSGIISNLGLVDGNLVGNQNVGALAGANSGSITNSYASSSVTATNQAGGLVGSNYGLIDYGSHASGSVTSSGIAGGLVANNEGLILYGYATGSVNGQSQTGGLVGRNAWDGRVSASYASGNASGTTYVGGLVGNNSGTVSATYATGSVTGNDSVGGLVGMNGYQSTHYGTILSSYATGLVNGSSNTGGLTGSNAAVVSNSFWDADSTAQGTVGCGASDVTCSVGATAIYSSAARSAFASATYTGWSFASASTVGPSADGDWYMVDGYTRPYLAGFLKPLTLVPSYDGSGTAQTDIAAYTATTSYDASKVVAAIAPTTLTLSSSAANAYTAALNGSFYSNSQQGYAITLAPRSISTPGSAAGDVVLNAPISWTSGTLAINTGGTITATAAINGSGVFDLQSGTWNQVAGSLPAFSAYDFRISGGTFIRALSGDGSGGNPYQFADIYGLQGSGSSGMLGKSHALANNLEASGTTYWNAGAGFNPIGSDASPFTGAFDGLGHTVSNLNINRSATDYIGLFGYLGSGASIANLGLVGGSLSGHNYVGGLAGYNSGNIANSYASISGRAVIYSGGLVGYNTGSITNSFATGMFGNGATRYIGGLVGYNDLSGSIASSYATGGSTETNMWYAGGLVGYNKGHITNSFATGAFTHNSTYVGGLVGYNAGGGGWITNSYATGMVAPGNTVGGARTWGGLAGVNNGYINSSVWDTTTSFNNYGCGNAGAGSCGVGYTTAEMQSFSNFSGWSISNTGGSSAVWRIYDGDSYPLLRSFLTPLTVTATSGDRAYDGSTAGLGVSYSTTPNANLLGAVTATTASKNVGSYTVTPTGLYSTSPQGYDIRYASGTEQITPKVVTLTAPNETKTYDGSTSYTTTAGDLTALAGSLVAGDTVTAATIAYTNKNAGNGNKTVSLDAATISDGNGGANYSVTLAGNSTSTISPKVVTLTAPNETKTYDGGTSHPTTAGDLTALGTSLVGGDTVTAASIAYTDKNAGAGNKTVSLDAATINDGNGGANYSVTLAGNSTSTIDKANLALSGSRTYDGTTTIAGNALTAAGVNGETFTVTGSGDSSNLASRNVQTESTLASVTGLLLGTSGNGGLAGNYNPLATGGSSVDVTARAITLTVPSVTKTYDGGTSYTTTADDLAALAGSLVSGDTLTAATIAYTNKNAGTGNKTVSLDTATISDGNGGANYRITLAGNSTSTINKATLLVGGTAVAANKVYDGTTTASISGNSIAPLGGDAMTLVQRGSFLDKNVANGKAVIYTNSLSGADASNYTLASGGGTTTADITPAILTVTANSVDKPYNNTPYSGGNGVAYSGFGAGDNASVLSGTLTYGGTSQGATVAGIYGITPGGLTTNNNYTLTFVDGRLTIAASSNNSIQAAISSTQNTMAVSTTPSSSGENKAPLSGNLGSPVSIYGLPVLVFGGGMQLPSGLDEGGGVEVRQ